MSQIFELSSAVKTNTIVSASSIVFLESVEMTLENHHSMKTGDLNPIFGDDMRTNVISFFL